jgi:hypothetical protein
MAAVLSPASPGRGDWRKRRGTAGQRGWLNAIVKENLRRLIRVPAEFARIVYLHIMLNVLVRTRARASLLLGIAGPPGMGKSVIVREICERVRVKIDVIAASSLEHHLAGVPAAMVRQAYVRCAEGQAASGVSGVVLFEDIDLGIGIDGNTTGTTNRQHVDSALMELTDHPTLVDGKHIDRVPVIFTANFLGKLHPPITRPGRMQVYCWKPGRDEIAEIARHILCQQLNAGQIEWVLARTPTWTPAHFRQLSMLLDEALVDEALGDSDPAEALTMAIKNPKAIVLPTGAGEYVSDATLEAAMERLLAEAAGKADFTLGEHGGGS